MSGQEKPHSGLRIFLFISSSKAALSIAKSGETLFEFRAFPAVEPVPLRLSYKAVEESKILSKSHKFFLSALFLLFVSARLSWAGDCWISVSGAGLKNGSDAANAYSASEGGQSKNAQVCWNQTSSDGTMHVMAGEYTVENKSFWRLRIISANDGTGAKEKNYKKLIGEGRVLLQGPRKVPYDPSLKTEGGLWLDISQGASRLWVQNFHISRIAEGISAAEGGNVDLQFHDLHFEDTRQNFIILGHPDCKTRRSCGVKPEAMTREILIKNTSGLRYSKRHVRLGNGVSKVKVENSLADAGFLDGDFAVGFDVEGPSHDIDFIRSSSRANIYTLTPYWNGDGFKSEIETKNIRWISCSAFDNGDGGFDIKTDNAYLENIIALRNNRNIRIWSSQKSVVKNANVSYAEHRGGIGAEAGIWSSGAVDCQFCTFLNNKIQILAENNGKGAQINLYDSILSMNSGNPDEWIRREKGTRVDLIRTVQWKAGTPGIDPKLGLGANAYWDGGNQEFNSILYGKTKGYHYE